MAWSLVVTTAILVLGALGTLALLPTSDRTNLVLIAYPTVTSIVTGIAVYVRGHMTGNDVNKLRDEVRVMDDKTNKDV